VKIGAELCVPVIGINLQHFFNAASAVLIVPFLLLGGCRIAGFIWPAASRVPQDRRRAIGLAIAVTFAVTAVFLAAMGFYRQRLAWILVPPVLVAVALELQTIRLAITRPRRWVFDSGRVPHAVCICPDTDGTPGTVRVRCPAWLCGRPRSDPGTH
jgi:hypothetical protein